MGVTGPKYADASQPYQTSYPMYLFKEGEPESWSRTKSPLVQTLGECGANDAPVIEVPEGATSVELVLNNVAPTAHVLHMHGMRFKVVNFGDISSTWCSTKHFECFMTP